MPVYHRVTSYQVPTIYKSRLVRNISSNDFDDDDDFSNGFINGSANRGVVAKMLENDINWTSKYLGSERVSASPARYGRSMTPKIVDDDDDDTTSYIRGRNGTAISSRPVYPYSSQFTQPRQSYMTPRTRVSYAESTPVRYDINRTRYSCTPERSIDRYSRAQSTPPGSYDAGYKSTANFSYVNDSPVLKSSTMPGTVSSSDSRSTLPPSGYIYRQRSYSSQKPEMSDMRKKIRRLICESKNDPHYFDD